MTYGYRSRFPKYDEQQREILSVLVLPRRLSPSRRFRFARDDERKRQLSGAADCSAAAAADVVVVSSPPHYTGKGRRALTSFHLCAATALAVQEERRSERRLSARNRLFHDPLFRPKSSLRLTRGCVELQAYILFWLEFSGPLGSESENTGNASSFADAYSCFPPIWPAK